LSGKSGKVRELEIGQAKLMAFMKNYGSSKITLVNVLYLDLLFVLLVIVGT